MQLFFYNTSSPNNAVTKELGYETVLEGALKNDCSITDPVILLEFNPTTYNYLFIPEFNRYYFINDCKTIRNQLFEIQAHCDVLMSFKDDIRNCYGVIEKQENDYFDSYIDDGSYRFENRIKNDVVNFPYGFNNNFDYILLTAGGL